MKHYGKVILLMAGIVAVSVLLTAITGAVGGAKQHSTVVTTTYPLYLAARHALAEVPQVRVENLTGAATGCLHDYQLSPADRIRLENAAVVLMNGGGAEAFLDGVEPGRGVWHDTGRNVDFLAAGHHHEEEAHEAHGEPLNEHIWVSPARYAVQVADAVEALAEAFPRHREAILRDGGAYRQQVEAVAAEVAALSDRLAGRPCVIFHESLAYLAADLGLSVTVRLSVGEESGVSAADLAAAQRAVEADPATLVLYDDQYTLRYAAVDAAAAPGCVLALNTGVRGAGTPEDWLTAMAGNVEMLKKAAEGAS